MTYITLNAHKKCIGQYNFDPLLYIDPNTKSGQQHLYLNAPGTYTIRYVSGAICSFNIDTIINELSACNKNIDKNQIYWNRYYQTSAMSLGAYDITYFPTSSILVGCFQCQFGTLPGFTDQGYKTKALAQTFNGKYLNNSKKYKYVDELKFVITQPQDLILWYTNITQQSVEGEITYSIDYQQTTNTTISLNDISVLGIDKTDTSIYSFENYYLNLNKSNFSDSDIANVQTAWLNTINEGNMVKSICDFNTIGYNSAFFNNIRSSDTINYLKQYSTIYYWQIIKKTDSEYTFIGKVNNKSPKILLYSGIYTMFVTTAPYKLEYGTTINRDIEINQDIFPLSGLSTSLSAANTYTFTIPNFAFLDFTGLLGNTELYLYKDSVTLLQLNNYIKNVKNSYQFITEYNQNVVKSIQSKIASPNINNITKIVDYTENKYSYYIDISQYVYYHDMDNPSSIKFLVYASQKIKNNISIGPYLSFKQASASIFTNIFPDLASVSANFISYQLSTNNNNQLQYIISGYKTT